MSDTTTGLIYQKIPAIMREVGAVGKNKTNQGQGYKFRGIDDMYNALHEHLSSAGVFATPRVMRREREERTSKNGGVTIYTILDVEHIFYAEDGSNVSVITTGEAMDSGDKSSNKAMSAAFKYALMEIFCIPTQEKLDTEYENHEIQPRERPQAQSPRPTPNGAQNGAQRPRQATPQAAPKCRECGGDMWDNRENKKNPKAPDFKCKDKGCDGAIWEKPRENAAPVEYEPQPDFDGEVVATADDLRRANEVRELAIELGYVTEKGTAPNPVDANLPRRVVLERMAKWERFIEDCEARDAHREPVEAEVVE